MLRLSDSFGYKKLLRFTFPSIIMMVFTSIYGMVDGFFVSNFVGETSFAAVNFIYPFIMVLGAFGFMFGTGGSALIAKTMGEGNREKANRIFSMLVYVSFGLGVGIAVLGIVLLRPIAAFLGAEGEMLENCVTYGRILLCAIPAFMLQFEFQSLFSVAEKPTLGLVVTVLAGCTNMALDAVFVLPKEYFGLGLGLEGAAYATALSQVIGGTIPLFYFFFKNKSSLRLGKPYFNGRELLKICTNGSSELMSNISMSLVAMLYNFQLMALAGEEGVSAYGVLMYVNMIFLAVFIGYSVGVSPIIGFKLGANSKAELKSILRKSVVIICVSAFLMLGAGLVLAQPLSRLYVGYSEKLLEITLNAFNIFSFSFLFAGMAIFGSGFFTALNDGLTSALISFLRTLVFQVAAVLILPAVWGIDGIWYSIVVAEAAATILSVIFILAKRKKYGY